LALGILLLPACGGNGSSDETLTSYLGEVTEILADFAEEEALQSEALESSLLGALTQREVCDEVANFARSGRASTVTATSRLGRLSPPAAAEKLHNETVDFYDDFTAFMADMETAAEACNRDDVERILARGGPLMDRIDELQTRWTELGESVFE